MFNNRTQNQYGNTRLNYYRSNYLTKFILKRKKKSNIIKLFHFKFKIGFRKYFQFEYTNIIYD